MSAAGRKHLYREAVCFTAALALTTVFACSLGPAAEKIRRAGWIKTDAFITDAVYLDKASGCRKRPEYEYMVRYEKNGKEYGGEIRSYHSLRTAGSAKHGSKKAAWTGDKVTVYADPYDPDNVTAYRLPAAVPVAALVLTGAADAAMILILYRNLKNGKWKSPASFLRAASRRLYRRFSVGHGHSGMKGVKPSCDRGVSIFKNLDDSPNG